LFNITYFIFSSEPTIFIKNNLGIFGKDEILLKNWVEEATKSKVKFELLWRGSLDGYGAGTFHSKCDNKKPTLTIISSNYGRIFGGFTSAVWDHIHNYRSDSTAFIYSLTYRIKCSSQKDQSKSIYASSAYGPIFGNGNNIIIYDNSNRIAQNIFKVFLGK